MTSTMPLRRLANAELRRLLSPAYVRYSLWALPALLAWYALAAYLGHGTDTDIAWRAAEKAQREYIAEATARGIPATEHPKVVNFFDDPRYLFSKAVFVDLRTVLSGIAVAGLVFGIRSGGADWSSRVMLTLAASEPRRPRLFAVRGSLLALTTAVITITATAVLVPLLALTAHQRGTLADADGEIWRVLALITLRGALLIALITLLGYCLGMLARGTALALGITLGYLVAAEQLFQEYVPSLTEYHLSGITFAALNERLLLGIDRTDCIGEVACVAMRQGTTGVQAFTALALYLLPLAAAAYWRFARRDIG
ncbi:hypothetical protein [Streptomyces sp. NPDC058953]|uniref:hypothetical protein n=1 Tax=unclassified Streptomyces TaxID=2593676 RepID=UPI003673999C